MRVYINYFNVSKQYIVPMLGRITHISVDESKQMLTPESSRTPTAAQLKQSGIKEEQPYYSQIPEIDDSFPVVDFMKKRFHWSTSRPPLPIDINMVQESTMICVDNSEWMRNGDFVPTRLQCQQDAANLILQCKLRANPENAVGLLSMANQVQVLSTMTQESGRLFMKLHQLEPQGQCNFMSAIKIAHLALKHRQNRNHKMRIVMFIGSPIDNLDSAEVGNSAYCYFSSFS
ncbi:hypothetical protein OESDEN_01111 [Oesophagostomum dentatum]|uniref:26S proteasome non-ATPase regulatory subunit 4 n=1 Tax=Oesophagostomum dentatum TaxID=61180 RepID=A0A0B1TSS7_OESDE|nr:hypothetical protein OESDEN_01111 [Oesophagostomum dentatum]